MPPPGNPLAPISTPPTLNARMCRIVSEWSSLDKEARDFTEAALLAQPAAPKPNHEEL